MLPAALALLAALPCAGARVTAPICGKDCELISQSVVVSSKNEEGAQPLSLAIDASGRPLAAVYDGYTDKPRVGSKGEAGWSLRAGPDADGAVLPNGCSSEVLIATDRNSGSTKIYARGTKGWLTTDDLSACVQDEEHPCDWTADPSMVGIDARGRVHAVALSQGLLHYVQLTGKKWTSSELSGQQGGVPSIAFTPTGVQLAWWGGANGYALNWAAPPGKAEEVVGAPATTEQVAMMAVSKDGAWDRPHIIYASASEDGLRQTIVYATRDAKGGWRFAEAASAPVSGEHPEYLVPLAVAAFGGQPRVIYLRQVQRSVLVGDPNSGEVYPQEVSVGMLEVAWPEGADGKAFAHRLVPLPASVEVGLAAVAPDGKIHLISAPSPGLMSGRVGPIKHFVIGRR